MPQVNEVSWFTSLISLFILIKLTILTINYFLFFYHHFDMLKKDLKFYTYLI